MIEFRILLNLFTFSSIIFIFILSFPLFYTSELNDISLFPFTYTAIRQSKRNYTIKWIKKKGERFEQISDTFSSSNKSFTSKRVRMIRSKYNFCFREFQLKITIAWISVAFKLVGRTIKTRGTGLIRCIVAN